MATPVSINQIWLGKIMAAVNAAQMIIRAYRGPVLGYLVINFGFVVPKAGSFISRISWL